MLAWGQFFRSDSSRYESLSTKLTLTNFSHRGPPNSGGHWQRARPPRSTHGALFWQSASSHRDSGDGGASHSCPLHTEGALSVSGDGPTDACARSAGLAHL